ncbi:MAG: hypothetical protein KGZ89_05940 [Actinobacteria bacterium]|nr:hypothetical protein [Actinomycetota bacterium]
MRFPVNILEISKSRKQLLREQEQPLAIQILVEVDTPESLIEFSQALIQPRAAALVEPVLIQNDSMVELLDSADVVIVLVGSGLHATKVLVAEAKRTLTPVVALMDGDDLGSVPESIGLPDTDVLLCADASKAPLAQALGEWLIKHLPKKKLLLANNFPFIRRAVSMEYVKSTALQNAFVGGLVIVPGADLPVMTANQAKMILQIAAAYGETLGLRRSVELLGVVGGGLTMRSIARQAAGIVPALGWAMKGGIAYSGTIAMGYAAIAYFERGDCPGSLKNRFDDLFAKGLAPKDSENSTGG